MWKEAKDCSYGETCRFTHSVNMVQAYIANGTKVILSTKLTGGVENVEGTITSSRTVKRPNGSQPRFYIVDVVTTHTLHEQFAHMMQNGIPKTFFTVKQPATVQFVPVKTETPLPVITVEEVHIQPTNHPPMVPTPLTKGGESENPTTTQPPKSPTPRGNECNLSVGYPGLNPVIDNACTLHIINTDKYFIPGTIRESVMACNFNSDGLASNCVRSGLIQMRQKNGGIYMDRWHYQPGASRTLLSLGRMTAIGYTMEILRTVTNIVKDGEVVFECSLEFEIPDLPPTKEELDNDYYVVPLTKLEESWFLLPENIRLPECNLVAPPPKGEFLTRHHEAHNATGRLGKVQLQNINDWHVRLCHMCPRKVAFVLGIRLRESLTSSTLCAQCACAKITSDKKGPPRPAPTKLLQTVYIDAVGPFTPSYQEGFRYMHTVHEKFSEHTFAEFTVGRAEGGPATIAWIDQANNRHHPLKVVDLIADGAPEYAKSEEFTQSLLARGVSRHINAPYAHHHGGNVEQPQRTVQDLGRAARIGAGMTPPFWAFACKNALEAKCIMPTRKSMENASQEERPITPHEVWTGNRATSYADLHRYVHTFGAQCIAHHPIESRKSVKNDDHGELGVYLCRALPNLGHQVLLLKSGKVRVFRTVHVHETVFPFLLELRKSVPHALTFAPKTVEEVEEQELPQVENTETPNQPIKIEEVQDDSDREDDQYDRLYDDHQDQESEIH